MPFCPSCGNEVNEQDSFCRSCGAELGKEEQQSKIPVEESLTKKTKPQKWVAILTLAIMEVVAIVGGLPLFGRYRGHEHPPYALFDNTGALVSFLLIVAGLTIYFTRHRPNKVTIYATILVVGILLATTLGVKALN